MSGIAGIVRLDGRRIERDDVAALSEAIAHRGSDHRGSWSKDSVALAHAALHTTPESVTEEQPVVDAESGAVIVADVRLDNRDELLDALDLRDRTIGDAALVLAAYRRWGTDCPRHLEGDFAFAIWSERERSLFCARDPFGVKPFVYALVPGTLFAFGSEPRAVLAVEGVPHDLDETRIAAFLAVSFEDLERTFFRAVRRLPGGCTLTLRGGGVTQTRYWSAESVRPLRLSSDAAYAEGFREHFVRAVRDRMRVTRSSELGSMLSGGLDSSAITCVARDQLRAAGADPLPVFSWVFTGIPDADEREYQEIVAADGGIVRHVIDSAGAGYSPWSGLDQLLPDGPPYAPIFYLNYGVAKLARALGVRTILDGLGGDSSISRGGVRPVELFVRGRFLALARELRALAATTEGNPSPLRLFRGEVIGRLAPPFLFRIASVLRGRPRHEPQRSYRPYLSVRQEHIASFRSPLLGEGLELFDRVLALSGVEGRYPFFDRRLVEYCISLPSDQKLADGYSRVVARRALRGVVPEQVLWRAGKGKPALDVFRTMRANQSRLDELFIRDPSVLAPYSDIDALRASYRVFLDERSTDFFAAVKLWSAAAAAEWLRQLRG
ncbi:MAG: hypothetical protein QOC81_1675 [Thermoanaerobaculia bacterium]|jgi:asparagine synthase (glutamine-hydrolysing)|nr:hypothetical protein [Thermoanaerobaculia bacterium]